MGTSTPFGGPKNHNPLVPSFVDDGDGTNANPPNPGNPAPPPSRPPVAPPPVERRYNRIRRAFNDALRSASSADMREAVGRYASNGVGSASNGRRRMGSSVAAAGRVTQFLQDVQERGLDEAVRRLNLPALAGRSVTEVLEGLVDHVCPDGGSIDEAIARNAYTEVITELAEENVDLDTIGLDQVRLVLERFVARSIQLRIIQDIGQGLLRITEQVATFRNALQQLDQLIRNAVSDAMARVADAGRVIGQTTVGAAVEEAYETTFGILQEIERRAE